MDGQDMVRIETPGGLVIAPNWDAVAKLHAKIARVASTIGAIAKDARNSYQNYDYVSYEQAAGAVKSACTEHGLAFSVGAFDPTVRLGETKRGDTNEVVALHLEGCFTDVDTGAMRIIQWMGEGMDTQDKAMSKAATSGTKYMLMRNLLFSDSETDPDQGAPAQGQQATTKHSQGTGTRSNDNGNGNKAQAVPWQGRFFEWLGQFCENQGIMDKDGKNAAYAWLKDNGKMREHLREYGKLGEAQKDAIAGMHDYVALLKSTEEQAEPMPEGAR